MVNPKTVAKAWSESYILGIQGYKGSGKDTVCSILSELTPVKRFAFADRLKDILVKDFNLLRDVLHGTQEEKDNTLTHLDWRDPAFITVNRNRTGLLTYREALTAVGELYGTTFFAKALMADLFAFQAYNPGYLSVVTDVRFHTEHWMLARAGASHIRVLGTPSGPGTDHPSENHKLSFNATVPGKGYATLDETRERLIDLLWDEFGIDVMPDHE